MKLRKIYVVLDADDGFYPVKCFSSRKRMLDFLQEVEEMSKELNLYDGHKLISAERFLY